MSDKIYLVHEFSLKEEVVILGLKFIIYSLVDYDKGLKVTNFTPGNMDIYKEQEFLVNSNKLIKTYAMKNNWTGLKSDVIYNVKQHSNHIVRFSGNIHSYDFDVDILEIVASIINK